MEDYITHPDKFKTLELEEQLQVVADITLYCAERKSDELERAGKTRLDSCVPALRWYDRQKYWEAVNQNTKKLAELEMTKVRQGV